MDADAVMIDATGGFGETGWIDQLRLLGTKQPFGIQFSESGRITRNDTTTSASRWPSMPH